jgi:hypothetical protein
MHILLLDTIECFKERENTVVPITYTARELLRVLPLNSMENECFADLVRRVEPTWFGPMEGSLEDYQGARESFKRLIDSVGKP